MVSRVRVRVRVKAVDRVRVKVRVRVSGVRVRDSAFDSTSAISSRHLSRP